MPLPTRLPPDGRRFSPGGTGLILEVGQFWAWDGPAGREVQKIVGPTDAWGTWVWVAGVMGGTLLPGWYLVRRLLENKARPIGEAEVLEINRRNFQAWCETRAALAWGHRLPAAALLVWHRRRWQAGMPALRAHYLPVAKKTA